MKQMKVTCYPDHDEDFCPGELGGFDSEDLKRMVCHGHVGKGGDAFEAVGRIEHQQTQKDDERCSVGNELHERTPQYFTQLEK